MVGVDWVAGLAQPFIKQIRCHPSAPAHQGFRQVVRIRLDLLSMSSTRPRPEDLGREESQPANPDAHAPEEPGDGGTGGHARGEPGSIPGTGHAQGGPGSGPGTEGHAQGEPESGPEGWQKQLSGLGSFILGGDSISGFGGAPNNGGSGLVVDCSGFC